jgi:ATP-binding cassette subfamily F protein 3
MSGGQKSRVAFALNVWNNPHILIMDEPTNHLDLDAVNALIIALNNFQGIAFNLIALKIAVLTFL